MKARYTFNALPPSVNHIWRHTKNGTFRTADYKAWQNGEGWNLKTQLPKQPKFSGPVYITAALRRPRSNADIDNRLKGIGDTLQSIGAITDDKLIYGWNAFWSADLPDGIAAEVSIVAADEVGVAA